MSNKNCEEVTTTGTDSSQLSFGKVISVERKNSTTEAVLSKQVFTYMTGSDGEVEIEKVETFDEAGQGTLVRFGYGPYGRVINRYEYGYKQAGVYQVRRRARMTTSMPRATWTRDSCDWSAASASMTRADALKAKTETTYDDYAAMGEMQNYGLNREPVPAESRRRL